MIPEDFYRETGIIYNAVRKACNRKDFQTAANMILLMLKSMPPIPEDGGVRQVNGLVLDRVELGFQEMVKLAARPSVPQELKDRMYRRSMDAAEDRRWPFEVLDPHWTDVLVVLRKDREEEVLRVIDSLLNFLSDEVDDQVLSRLLSKKIVLLRAMDREDVLPRLLEQYPHSQSLWDLLIGEEEKKKDYANALRLANRASQLFEAVDPEISRRFDDKSWFLERHFNREEPIRLAKVYAGTQDWKALFEVLEKKEDLLLLRQYTQELLPDYMARLLPLYKKCLQVYAADLRSRHAGANAAMYEIMKMIRDWPGGQKVVDELVAEFHELYPKREKLLEALDRLALP